MDDLISRQQAIDAVKIGAFSAATIYGRTDKGSTALHETVRAIKALPPAEPQWIPCSERLPDDLQEVNVTWVNHDPEPYYNFVKDKPFTATAVYYKEKWYWYSSTCADLLAEYGRNPNQEIDDGIEITAWMPLPEPYKGEQV